MKAVPHERVDELRKQQNDFHRKQLLAEAERATDPAAKRNLERLAKQFS